MIKSRAEIPTEHASRYLQQLCKHWSHKFEVEFTPEHGSIALPLGTTVLDASGKLLTVQLDGSDETAVDRLETVVAEHIQRFAFREELAFASTRAAA